MSFIYYRRPPATVLAKPAPIRSRKDSSDAEPSPPNSPSYLEEDHASNITVSQTWSRLRWNFEAFLKFGLCLRFPNFVTSGNLFYWLDFGTIFSDDHSENVRRRLTRMTLITTYPKRRERKRLLKVECQQHFQVIALVKPIYQWDPKWKRQLQLKRYWPWEQNR